VLDLVVANTLIVDGRGAAPFRGSLGVRGDRIVWIRGGTAPPEAARTIDGDGLDADLFRSYLAAFGDRESYAVSHVGFGMNRAARWDYLELYDKAQINGTEARAFAGNFLFSTGANENAGRYTAGHFDLPMRNCTIALDGRVVVDAGALQGDLA